MPWRSLKHPLDETKIIAATDTYPLQKKHLQCFKSLKYYLKELYLNIKAL